MHLYNRVAGPLGEFPLGPAEKEYFIGLMRKLLRLYTIEIVAYWVYGLVIGSEIFVKTVLARARGEAAVAQRRLTRARAPDPLCPRPDLYCCRQLREIV